MLKFALGTIAIFLAATALPAGAQSVSADIKAQLAPSGTLRAAINYNNPLLAKRDPTTGELSGVAVDLSRELARRTGLPLQLLPFGSAGEMSAASKTHGWDIAYLAIDPARATDITYTGPYLDLEGTYLVPPGSALQRIEDVDRPGVRIAVTTGSAYDLYLTRALKHAQLVHAKTTPLSLDLLTDKKADTVAAVRTFLASARPKIPGSRVLDGHFMIIPQAAGVPRGRPLAAHYVSQFIEEMKASGFVAAALKRHGLGPDDALVAPPTPVQ